MDIRTSAAGVRRYDLAEDALEQFEEYGKFLNEQRGAETTSRINQIGAPASVGGVGNEGISKAKRIGSDDLGDELKDFGVIGKTLSRFGAMVDGASGVGELAQTFAEERQKTDFASRMNVATLGKSIEVTARISATSIVGTTVCASLAAATGLTVAPIVIGAAAGVAAGYTVGKLAEAGRYLYRKAFS